MSDQKNITQHLHNQGNFGKHMTKSIKHNNNIVKNAKIWSDQYFVLSDVPYDQNWYGLCVGVYSLAVGDVFAFLEHTPSCKFRFLTPLVLDTVDFGGGGKFSENCRENILNTIKQESCK